MDTGLEELDGALPEAMEGVRKQWPWLIALGVVLVILGFITIGAPFAGITAIKQLLGWILLATGVGRAVHAIATKHEGRMLLDIVTGIVQIVVAVFLLTQFEKGARIVLYVLVAYFIADGIINLAISLKLYLSPLRIWLRLTGVLSLVLAFLILFKFLPAKAPWAIGLAVGVNLAFHGWTMIVFAITIGPLAEDADI